MKLINSVVEEQIVVGMEICCDRKHHHFRLGNSEVVRSTPHSWLIGISEISETGTDQRAEYSAQHLIRRRSSDTSGRKCA